MLFLSFFKKKKGYTWSVPLYYNTLAVTFIIFNIKGNLCVLLHRGCLKTDTHTHAHININILDNY